MRFTLRTFALAVCAAVATAAIAPAAAFADEAPSLDGTLSSATIGVAPAPGKALPLLVQGHNAMEATATVDLSGLAGKVTVEAPNGCHTSGQTLTCTLPTSADFDTMIPLGFRAAAGAKAGDAFTVTCTLTARNIQDPFTFTTTVSVGDGIDLVGISHAPLTGKHPGDAVDVPVDFANAGSKAAVGVRLTLMFDPGTQPDILDNCTYARDQFGRTTAVCELSDLTLEPGFEAVGTVGERLTADTTAEDFTDQFFEGLAEKPLLPSRTVLTRRAHTGHVLTLAVHRRPAGTRAGTNPPADVDPNDNFALAAVKVVGTHFDVAADRTTGTGRVGDVVKVTVGVTNKGPAMLDATRAGGDEPAAAFAFAVPPHTQVVAAPKTCVPFDQNNPGEWGAPGGTYYLCNSAPILHPGDRGTAQFSLKITAVVPDDKGTVSLDIRGANPPVFADDNAADNTADVMMNPSSGGGLPVTGQPTALIALAGLGAVLVGAVLVLLGRRRRAARP